MKWAIRVIDRAGYVMFLRHGEIIGEGAIVAFTRKRDALEQVDILTPGCDEGERLSVVPYPKDES